MKKFVVTLMVVAVVVFALSSVGVAYAQSPTQTPGTGVAGWVGVAHKMAWVVATHLLAMAFCTII